MPVFDSILDLVGRTPIVRLSLPSSQWQLFLKLEKFNPGQSMKDRIALNMVNQAEKSGLLHPGGTIIESSSGNTATGLAMIAAARGYHFIAIVDHHAAQEKLDTIRAYGGEIRYVKGNYKTGEVAVMEREEIARKLSQEIPNAFFTNQADNLENRNSYLNTMATDLLEEVGPFDILFGSIGTGGSLSGTAEGLKKVKKELKVVAIEPVGSTIFTPQGEPYLQSGTGNPVGADIPKNVNFPLIDEHYYASDKQAFNTCHFFARKKGLLLGGSGGGVLYKAIEYLKKQPGSGTAVAIIADGGEKYISTIFNDKWIASNDLLDIVVSQFLEENL